MSVESKLKEIKTKLDSMPDSETKRAMLARTNEHLAKYEGLDKVTSLLEIEKEVKSKALPEPVPSGLTGLDDLLGYEGKKGGFYKKNHYVLAAPPKSGKGQPLDTKILTEVGYVKMGRIKVGDNIIGSNGKNTEVLGVFPQGKKDVYKFTFSDNSSVKCDYSHLWKVQSGNQRKDSGKHHVLSTLEIIEYMKKYNNDLYIPMVEPVEFINSGELIIEPYKLGVLIGDGCFQETGITLTNSELDITNKISGLSSHKQYNDFGVLDSLESIKSLGLENKKSYEKFIPKDYLYTNVENRRKLLAGLIDTDGSVCVKGTGFGCSYEYSTTSNQLSKDVQFLVQSLGGTAKITKRKGRYKKNGTYIQARDNYRIAIKPSDNDFYHSSEKHNLRFKPYRRGACRKIKSIEYVGMEETQCIQVSAEDSLYVTENFIVTHNTAMMLELVNRMQDKNPMLIPLEQPAIELVETMVERGIKVPKAFAPYTNKIPDLHWVEERVTEAVVKYNSEIVFIDHLSYLAEETRKEEHLKIRRLMQGLKVIASELDIIIVTLVHINKHDPLEIPTVQALQGSSSIHQEASGVLMMWREHYKQGKMVHSSNKVLLQVQANRRTGNTGSIKMEYKDFKFKEDDTIKFEYERTELDDY